MARDRELSYGLAGFGAWTLARQTQGQGLKKLEPVLISALFAVGLHVAMFSVPVRNEPALQSTGWFGGSRAAAVRMLPPEEGHLAGGKMAQTKVRDETTDQRARNDEAAQEAETIGSRHRTASGDAPVSASPEIHGLTLRLPGVLGEEDFFARNMLDVGPYPTQPVLIDYPSSDTGSGTHASELSLFIDENGRVVRIRVDGPSLPPAMEEAARQAFMGAVFTPGQVDGLPVRSRIRVEVVFEEGSAGR